MLAWCRFSLASIKTNEEGRRRRRRKEVIRTDEEEEPGESDRLLDHWSRRDRWFGCLIFVQDITVPGRVIIISRVKQVLCDAKLEECWIICGQERSFCCACVVEVWFGSVRLGLGSSMKTNERRTCRGR